MINQLRVCSKSGCHELTHGAYCQWHRNPMEERNTARWRKVRKVILREHPICEHCGRTFATEVNHIVPIIDGGAEYDLDNLEALCTECHKTVTREQRTGGW